MKNLIIILLGAGLLLSCLFACHNDNAVTNTNTSYEDSIVTVIHADGIKGELIPINLDWNERVLASFRVDDHTCELLVGYMVPKYSALSNYAHRKVVVIGKSGHWDKRAQNIFVFDDGSRANLVPSYPVNSISPMPKMPLKDTPLEAVDQLPARR